MKQNRYPCTGWAEREKKNAFVSGYYMGAIERFSKEKTNDTSNMVWGERWKYIFGADSGNEMEVEAFWVVKKRRVKQAWWKGETKQLLPSFMTGIVKSCLKRLIKTYAKRGHGGKITMDEVRCVENFADLFLCGGSGFGRKYQEFFS